MSNKHGLLYTKIHHILKYIDFLNLIISALKTPHLWIKWSIFEVTDINRFKST